MNPQQPTSEPQGNRENRQEDRYDFHPGQTISPRNPGPAAPVQEAPAPSLPVPVTAPSTAQAAEAERSLYNPSPSPAPVVPDTQPAGQDSPPPQDAETEAQPSNPRPQNPGQVVSWTASEFVAHEKSQSWYLGLGGAALAISVLIYLVTRDIFSTGVVIIAAVLFGVAASRQPRQLPYEVDLHGLTIGNKHYPYADFRSFSVSEEGPLHSINFMPLKRFAPPLTIYYDPTDEDRITAVLASHLPLENHKHDAVDKLMRRIRF